MKAEIICILKAYAIGIVVLLSLVLILALILMNNPGTIRYGNILLKISLGFTFFSLGFLFGNHAQTQGIIRGLVAGMVTIIIVYLIYFLNDEPFNFIYAGINIVCSGLGGIVGVHVKKMI